MQSIGLWNDKKNENNRSNIELHINLWNISGKSKEVQPFVDFGIGIKNFRVQKDFVLLLPFTFEDNELLDLYENVKDVNVACLIFNEMSCEIESIDEYSKIKIDGREEQLLLPIKKNNALTDFVKVEIIEKSYKALRFDFSNIINDTHLNDLNSVYIRFRIKCNGIKQALFCPVDKQNWFLESGFVKTQILDIKLNYERNLPVDFCKQQRLKGSVFSRFDKIHLLVMCNSNVNVESIEDLPCDCRKLEESGWENYLGKQYNVSNILAYHWKKKDEKEIKNFSKLIRLTSSATNKMIIGSYLLMAILLGIMGNVIYDLLKYIFGVN